MRHYNFTSLTRADLLHQITSAHDEEKILDEASGGASTDAMVEVVQRRHALCAELDSRPESEVDGVDCVFIHINKTGGTSIERALDLSHEHKTRKRRSAISSVIWRGVALSYRATKALSST